MNTSILLSLVLATTAILPTQSFAGDATAASCQILIDEAKAQAADQAQDMLRAMNDGPAHLIARKPYARLTAAGLPAAAHSFESQLSQGDRSLAQSIEKLRTQLVTLAAQQASENSLYDRDVAMYGQAMRSEQWQEAATLNVSASHHSVLSQNALSDQIAIRPVLDASLESLLNRASRAQSSLTPGVGYPTYDPEALAFRVCSAAEHSNYLFCAVIDLKSDATTYTVATGKLFQLFDGTTDDTDVTVDLGSWQPFTARNNLGFRDYVRSSIEFIRLSKLPAPCQSMSKPSFATQTDDAQSKSVISETISTGHSATNSSVTAVVKAI